MRLENEVDFSCCTKRTLRCDLKTEIDFSCRAERTLNATIVVDFVPHGVDLRCKNEMHFRKAKSNERSEKTSSLPARAVYKKVVARTRRPFIAE
jgi:hypothetical protein